MNLIEYLRKEPPHMPLLKLLFKHKSNITILDIGSCEGEDSLRYLQAFPESHVIAFEPYPSNIKRIQSLINSEFGVRFSLIEAAVSDKDGEAILNISSGQPPGVSTSGEWDYGNKSSSLLSPADLIYHFHPWLQFSKKLRVPTLTLDCFAASKGLKSIDFIHMDIQGGELKALRGAAGMLPKIGAIWLEVSDQSIYEGQPTSADISQFLTSHGFSLVLTCMQDGFGDHFYVNNAYFNVNCLF